MVAALLALLPALGGKLPSIATLKLVVVGLIAALAVGGYVFGFAEYAEVEKLKGQHQEAQAKAESAQLALQKHWDAIGAKDEADYLARIKIIRAETQRQSQELERRAKTRRVATSGRRKSDRPASDRIGDSGDSARVIGVLRDAYGTH